MTHPIRNRSRLLLGCGSTALALALTLAPQAAQAQAINATGNVVSGSASIDTMVPGQTTVDVASPTAVIDWTPTEDAGGNALDFLPTNTTALFQSGQQPTFAVLNRILPSTNGNIVVIDGNVLSRVNDAQGLPVAGGFVAFYSPTGILIGDNATFDVGQLLLTTLDVSAADFSAFAELGANMTLAAAPGSTARIQINPGATITATPENSFFAVVAADVQMRGTAQVNGSHAFVAGEVVNLSFSNGLFFISVPVGTAATGSVMEVDGTIGGPSSTGVGDNHMIYGVAAAQADPISMLFSGNLGFDPAQSAGVVNGEIILSANYNVFGRNVNGGSVSDGINAVFGANAATSDTVATIFMSEVVASSSLLAISSFNVSAVADQDTNSVNGNLMLVAGNNATLQASNGQSFVVTGDVLVSAQDYGVVSSSLQSLDQINAQGGNASVTAFNGSTIQIGGNARVVADAFAGADDLNGIAGTAVGGTAGIAAIGGTVDITGSVQVSARGNGTSLGNILTGATSQGGLTQIFVDQGGLVTLGGNLSLDSSATGAQGSLFSPSTVSDALGGEASLVIVNGGGSITVGGDATLNASATGGSSNNAGAGSLGDAGVAIANIDAAGQITVTGTLNLAAVGIGGTNAGGVGGVGLGGRASSVTFGGGGTIGIGVDFNSDTTGVGGNGQTGGDGFGGIGGANAVLGSITIGGDASAVSEGEGGNASFGFGGTGGLGRGGSAFFQANGTLTTPASLTITGNASVSSNGFGGNGGASDGNTIAAGRGGDGYGGQFTVPNQADPAFGSGAFLLAGGDNGTLSIGGTAFAFATGFGGFGGNGGSTLPGGRGGDAFGGLAQVGLALLGQDGSLAEGSASFGSLLAEANANAGTGGFSIGDFPTGDGGNATGGNAFLTVRAGTVTAPDVALNASAFGGDGALGGLGTGGNAAVLGSLGGSLTTGQILVRADGFGGFGGFDALAPGGGGDGRGGAAEIDLQGITVQINGDATVQAEGTGGGTGDFTAGNGIGGNARLGMLGALGGNGTVTGNTIVSANGFGGTSGNLVAGISGNGTGGAALVQAQGGGTVSLNTLQMMANGFAGEGEVAGFQGGNGTGGNASMVATGTNSQITVARNVTTQQFTPQNFGAIMSATGVGGLANGGTGIGGTGRGGSVQLTAASGGSIALPATPLTDPDSVGFIRLFSRGFGGNSAIDGGTGGDSFGGAVAIDVDGGAFSMGETVLSSFTQGGTAEGTGINVTGGNAFAGSRRVSIRNGGTATMHFVGGGAGAQGGAGTGTGNGGNAYIGQNLFEVVNATAEIIGTLAVFDQSQGGTGQQGGSVFRVNPQTGQVGSLDIVLDNAAITFTPDAAGVAALGVAFTTRGGDGIVRGGDAEGPVVNLTINQTNLSGGRLEINPFIEGGNASALTGIGGDALGSPVTIAITNSQLTLPGETIFAADARGGTSGANAVGGNASSGPLDVTITGSTINLVADQQGVPGVLRVRSQANGGLGGTVGNALTDRAALFLVGSTLNGSGVYVESRAFANATAPGQPGGSALSREARIELSGVSGITANNVEINANATSSQGGSATAGFASLQAASGSTATVTAPVVNILADATGTADDMAGIAVATEGGQALVAANGGSLTITGNVFANARGIGATSANLLTGATSRGGDAQFLARGGGSIALGGSLFLDASATGANGSLTNPSSVSDAFGGNAVIVVAEGGGTITIGGDARLSGSAVGGTSNNAGAGSIGDAGVALANIQGAGLIDITGLLELAATAAGGTNAGGTGGVALGGRASATTFGGGTIRMGRFDADSLAEGGNGQTGGDAFGGIAGANAVTGEIAIAGRAFAGSEAVGGDASFGFGGNGGLGRAGNAFFQANGTLTQTARLTIGDDAIAFAQGVGGDGGASDGNTIAAGRGGDGYGGQFTVPNQADPAFGSGAYILAGGDNGTIIVGGDAVAVATAAGGTGGDGSGAFAGGRGGDAFGGLAQVGLALLGQDGSLGQGSATFTTVLAQSDAFGGNGGLSPSVGVTGAGGNATGGASYLTVRAGDITADVIDLSAAGFAFGGAPGGIGTGGEAAVFGSLGGTLTANQLNVLAQGFGGSADQGTGGDAFGGLAALEGDSISVTITGDIRINASATGGASNIGAYGDATGGSALVNVTGNTQVNAGLIEIVSNAETSTGGTTQGGTSSLQVASGSTATINASTINLLANAFGGNPASLANAAGVFSVNIGGGNVNAVLLSASAQGDTIVGDPPASELVASGGNLNVRDNLTAVALGDILVRTGGGGIIGGPRAAATTTLVTIDSDQTITIEGDNSATGGLGGLQVSLTSRDLDIAAGARVAADSVDIRSRDTAHTAVIGGTAEGDGFTLTADELGRISARNLGLFVSENLSSTDPNLVDLLIRDVSLTGSGGNGFETINIGVDAEGGGIVRVEGTLALTNAGDDDLLNIFAGRRLEVVTPGGIRVEGANNRPGGILSLNASDIWAADADTIAQLRTDRNFAGRDALLAAAVTGSDDPLGYLRGREVRIDVGRSLLVRNTGVEFEGGGILVGDGGLSITGPGSSQSTTSAQLDVFAYGRRQAADGSFILGEAFFDEVNFNRIAPGSTTYLDAAAFNDCIINTGICPEPPPPTESPIELVPEINNPVIIEEPLQTGGEPPMTAEEEEERFGMDFPERPDAPLISEDPLLDDPVSSGGDASLYSGNTGAAAPDGGEQ